LAKPGYLLDADNTELFAQIREHLEEPGMPWLEELERRFILLLLRLFEEAAA